MSDSKDLMIIDADKVLARASELSTIIDRMRQHGSLREGTDYGVIPGTTKPTLYKSGAERLCSAFQLRPEFTTISAMEDWDKGRFAYTESCTLVHIPTGMVLASGIQGHCNSLEDKYRYRWLWANQVKDQGIATEGLVKRTTKNGKVQYRFDNDDIYTQVNTLKKMAQKRALIAAVLIATNASDQFTQDMEDIIVQTESEVEQSPLRTPRLKRVDTQEPEKVIQPGERRHVQLKTVEIRKRGNGRMLAIRAATGEAVSVFTREEFIKAGYIAENDWTTPGITHQMGSPLPEVDIIANDKGYFELVPDTLTKFDPMWELPQGNTSDPNDRSPIMADDPDMSNHERNMADLQVIHDERDEILF